MNMHSKVMKSRSSAAALGSVKAEGFKPTKKTQAQVKRWVDGKITKNELRKNVVSEMRTRNAN